MSAEGLDELLGRLERLISDVEELDDDDRELVFSLLDGIDALHRAALERLGSRLGAETLARLRSDPLIAWLLDAYGVGVDQRAAAEAALEEILPYIHSHGGAVEVVDAAEGSVRLRMSGSCSGCTASAITLREGVERALRDNFPGFRTVEVEEADAAPHPPPGPTLLEIKTRPGTPH